MIAWWISEFSQVWTVSGWKIIYSQFHNAYSIDSLSSSSSTYQTHYTHTERASENKAVSTWCERSIKGDMTGESSCGNFRSRPASRHSSHPETACSAKQTGLLAKGKWQCKGNWIWLLHVLTRNFSANLCHGRSRLSTCSSGCAGKSQESQATGWCRRCPGCNLRTTLVNENTQEFGWRREIWREQRGGIEEGKEDGNTISKFVCAFTVRLNAFYKGSPSKWHKKESSIIISLQSGHRNQYFP